MKSGSVDAGPMEGGKVKYYITKYALSSGVIVADDTNAKRCSSDSMLEYQFDENNRWSTTYFHQGEWFTDRNEAIARCEVLRARKVTSVEKQLNQLRRIDFDKAIP